MNSMVVKDAHLLNDEERSVGTFRIAKFGYVVALWVAFNTLFVAQTIYYYQLHKVRCLSYLLVLQLVLIALTVLVVRSRKVGLPVSIALSFALGLIPYEYGIPFLQTAFGGLIESCSGAGCDMTYVVHLAKSFALSTVYFLLLIPMVKLKKAGQG